MAPRPRRRTTLTSAQRGYDHQHRQIRAALLPAAIGTHCPVNLDGCDGLMRNPRRMHLDHSQGKTDGRRGDRIICAHCNCKLGQAYGQQLRRRAANGSRNWFGQ